MKAVGRTGSGCKHCWQVAHTLYVLDGPTVGLHRSDVKRLIDMLHRMVNGGGRFVAAGTAGGAGAVVILA
jgi:ABC-type transport system involved in cytochrome c biogenesis ATPase subunit